MARKTKRIILCEGAAENSGSFCYVFGDLTIYPGQKLEVGNEINEEEAEQLLQSQAFTFKEVTE